MISVTQYRALAKRPRKTSEKCLDEKKALVYGVMLDRMKQETKVNQ